MFENYIIVDLTSDDADEPGRREAGRIEEAAWRQQGLITGPGLCGSAAAAVWDRAARRSDYFAGYLGGGGCLRAHLVPGGNNFVDLAILAVEPEKQRRGVGSALLRRLEQDARASGGGEVNGIQLVCIPSCVAFYEKHGYRLVDGGATTRMVKNFD
jgi:GNAT superfamily N-acetyltransferase